MIKEAYVSFEVAKLLKDKGFDEPCRTYYEEEELVNDVCTQYYQWNSKSPFGHISAPTHQMAMKWLREVYGIHVSAIPCAERHTIVWQQNIIDLKPIKEGGMFLQLEPHRKDYNSYEEAVEAAIKYLLENLI